MDTFGPIAYILEHCGFYFLVFLFLKPIMELTVIIIRHMELNRMTVASLGFGRTLLSASHKIFLSSVMTSMYDPQASSCASDAPKKVDPRVNIELYEIREGAERKEEQL